MSLSYTTSGDVMKPPRYALYLISHSCPSLYYSICKTFDGKRSQTSVIYVDAVSYHKDILGDERLKLDWLFRMSLISDLSKVSNTLPKTTKFCLDELLVRT